MTSHRPAGLTAFAAAFAATAALAGPAHTPAKPTLEGMWAHNYVLLLESPPGAPGLVVSDPAAAKALGVAEARQVSEFFAQGLDPEVPALMAQSDGLPVVRGQWRSRIVIDPADGKVPFRPQVRAMLYGAPPSDPPNAFDDPERRPSPERCLVGAGQPPLSTLSFAWVMQIVKTPGAVAIHTEYGDDVRVVPITDRHGPAGLAGRLGDSIGRWEGDTLVVETIGMPDADSFRLAPTFLISGAAKITERFTAVSDKELFYEFTVDDPKFYTAPWRAEFSWRRSAKPMYEHACHEGNHSLPDILAGARYREKTAAAGQSASR